MKLRFTGPKPLRALISAQGRSLQLGVTARPIAVVKVTQGLTGRPGTTGEAQISADAGNQLTQGSDQRLFVAASFTVAARFAEIAENPTAQDQARQNLGLLTIDGGTFN